MRLGYFYNQAYHYLPPRFLLPFHSHKNQAAMRWVTSTIYD